MAFYWKFTRSGKFSRSYISLIVDATPDSINPERRIWHTSFEEIAMCLILLHDVEVNNVPSLGLTKPAFRDVVRRIGYEPSSEYRETRIKMGLVKGQSVMGRHGGSVLDWGYYNDKTTPIDVDIADFQVSAFINAEGGKLWNDGEDKLSCFRHHPDFVAAGIYYDLMPKHNVMEPLANYLLRKDANRANRFFENFLIWTKLKQ